MPLRPLRPLRSPEMSLGQKLWQVNWAFVLLITLTASIGFAMLYSAANGSFDPWASRQMARFAVGLVVLVAVAVTDIRFWLRYAYILYFASLALLVGVELMGAMGMGARRWLDLGFFSLQPSEIAKVTVILALARYFYAARVEDVGRVSYLLVPVLLVAAPVLLVLRQPDLGTAGIMLIIGILLFFLAGVRAWMFIAVGAAAVAAVFPLWNFVLHDYQKQRILTYFNQDGDPLGSGYHIIQSKIALGSGGIFGKGFMQGTQSHLNFLPEKQTDFIFTMLAEEFGMMGGLFLMALYVLILAYGFAISLRCRSHFGRLVAMGVSAALFVNIFINIAMVMGLVPVVGMPLPIISYGGTALLTLMFALGLLMCVYVHRDVNIGPGAAQGDY